MFIPFFYVAELSPVFHVPHFQHEAHVVSIQNKDIKLGIDLNLGGSITYLAPIARPELNVVNSADWGRQIQLSFYSGPVPFKPAGAVISPTWEALGWNPIQSGDAFRNTSTILASKINRDRLYVKCVPMQWPLNNFPGECVFEVWLQLDGPTVKARCRLTNKRSDLTQYLARTQELPAVYVNAPYHHLMTYMGDRPFRNDYPSEIYSRLDIQHHWANWLATEGWAAQVDDQGFGLGIWNPSTSRFSGGFFGEPGRGGPSDSPTGYIAPNRNEILDHDVVYDFNYVLILGKLDEIRDYVYKHTNQKELPNWSFANSRAGWSYDNTTDSGWPIRDGLNFKVVDGRTNLVSPEFAVQSTEIRDVVVDASFSAPTREIVLDWKSSQDSGFDSSKGVRFPIIPDGKRRAYHINIGPMLSPPSIVTQLRVGIASSKSLPANAQVHRIWMTR